MIHKLNSSFLLIFIIAVNISWSQTNNAPPIIDATGDQAYCPASQINIITNFSIVDPDDTEIGALHIQISTGYSVGQDQLILTGNHPNIVDTWNATEGKLSLRGFGGANVSYVNLIAAVNDVVFESNSLNVTGDKFFSFTVGDANYLPSTDHYYEYVSNIGVSWTAAKAAAEARTYFGLQGYLATITSAEEAQLTGEQAEGTGWIGASDEETEGTWKWVTGPEAGSTFWFGNANGTTTGSNIPYENWNNTLGAEPNNAKEGGENYAHIVSRNLVPLGQGELGTWNDLPNAGSTGNFHPQGYIVEYGGMPGDPVVNISASTKISISSVISVIDAEICGPGSVVLEAISSEGTIIWFDALTGGNQVHTGLSYITPIINLTTSYYASASVNGCLNGIRTQVTATINLLPSVLSSFIFKNCDEDGIPDGFTDFNLNEVNSFITSEDLSSLNITYYLSSAEANTGFNPIALPFNNQVANTVFARVEKRNTGCFKVSTINLEVSTTSFSLGYLEELESCDDDAIIDGLHTFDLTVASSFFIGEFPTGQNLSVHYYRNLNDTQLEENEIVSQIDYVNETSFSQILYVRVESDDNGECFGIGPHLLLTVDPRPEFEVEQSSIYCLDNNAITLSTFNPNGEYTYQWFDENNNVVSSSLTATVNSGEVYTVIATSNFGCESFPVLFDVEESEISTIETDDITVVDLSNNNTISIDTINIGIGDYEFSLDEEFGSFKDEPFFQNILAGMHTLFVRDKKGCGTVSLPIFVMIFPKFFTPNGDGFNDTWNVMGLATEYLQNTEVFIYDRHGKLIKHLIPGSLGWNGTFNGKELDSSDYWFLVNLIDDTGISQIYKGHFSLVR